MLLSYTGMDLLLSTARQILLYRALEAAFIPDFYHCPLLRDPSGKRLAKRSKSESLAMLRDRGITPEEIIDRYLEPSLAQNVRFAIANNCESNV